MIRMVQILTFPLLHSLPFSLSHFFTFSYAQDSTALRFAQTITAEDAYRHLSVLAADEYEGRETGKEGQKKAAQYIAEHFLRLGLTPVKETSGHTAYFQPYPLLSTTPDTVSLQVNGKSYMHFQDYYCIPFVGNLNIKTSEIIFLGYGIEDKKYNDYKNTDVKGKVVMALGGEPMHSDSVYFLTGTKKPSQWTLDYRKKIRIARLKGAAALLIVDGRIERTARLIKHLYESPSLRLVSEEDDDDAQSSLRQPGLAAGISEQLANEILAAKKYSVQSLKEKINKKNKPISETIRAELFLSFRVKADTIYAENVLGWIPGSELPDEVIILTAHYDHLGIRNKEVYNGADDNASGTAAIMEIAEAFALAKQSGFAPRRSIAFMAVSGEERGLLGSAYYVKKPIFPLAGTVCNLNVDMLGRTDEEERKSAEYIYIIGSDKHSAELHSVNEHANSTYTKLELDYRYNDLDDPNRFYYRSDHYNFAEKGIPVIFYFSGVHEDYHQPTDEIDKIIFPLLTKRAQLIFFTTWELANRKERIKVDVK